MTLQKKRPALLATAAGPGIVNQSPAIDTGNLVENLFEIQSRYVARRARLPHDANGGDLRPQPARSDGLASFLIDYQPGADRKRCRAIMAEARNEPGVLASMIAMAGG